MSAADHRPPAALAERLAVSDPDLVTVFAYRCKTPGAAQVAAELSARLPPAQARFAENVPDILALLAGASAVVFPVDDLWGKVDLPIVLLEAMQLGVPVLALDQGPLCDLGGVVKVPDLAADRWLDAVSSVLGESAHAAHVVSEQRAALDERHRAASVARAYEDLYLGLVR